MRPTLLITTLLILTSNASTAQTTESASMSELGQMNRDFAAALNAKDAAKAASLYTEDAVLIPPGESVVEGRAAIEEYWRGAIESGGVRDVQVETMHAQSSGDIGYEIGSFSLTVTGPNGEEVIDRGRYIELLRRGGDGKWYSTAGIWNAAPQEAGGEE